jgi:hypothetical protein
MLLFRSAACLCLALLLTAGGSLAARAQSSSGKALAASAAVDVGAVAGKASKLIELLRLADRLTTVKGQPTVTAESKADLDKVTLVATYRVPDVKVEHFLTNKVLGVAIPGRKIKAVVRVDCLVHYWIDFRAMRVRQDEKDAKTLVVMLPGPARVTSEFAEGAMASYEVEYGELRVPRFNRAKAKHLRMEMYDIALEKARGLVEGLFAQFQTKLASDVASSLRAQHPGFRIAVKWE